MPTQGIDRCRCGERKERPVHNPDSQAQDAGAVWGPWKRVRKQGVAWEEIWFERERGSECQSIKDNDLPNYLNALEALAQDAHWQIKFLTDEYTRVSTHHGTAIGRIEELKEDARRMREALEYIANSMALWPAKKGRAAAVRNRAIDALSSLTPENGSSYEQKLHDLLNAAQTVVDHWETGDLAAAIRALDDALGN